MGYPMTYDRVLNRNGLCGNYTHVRSSGNGISEWDPEGRIARSELYNCLRMISGDMRRLERDCMDDTADYSHHRRLCEYAGVDSTTLRRVLHAFFTDCGTMPLPTRPPHDEA